jgi:hypothetical protein
MKLIGTAQMAVFLIIAVFGTHLIDGWLLPAKHTVEYVPDSAKVAQVNDEWSKRLKESEKGLSFWKSLAEKQVKPIVFTQHDTTSLPAKIFYIPGDSVILRDTLIKYLDFEMPYFVKLDGSNLSVGTRNLAKDNTSLWSFSDLGRNWDLAVTKSGLSVTTAREYFRFDGFGLGGGVRYDDGLHRTLFFGAFTRATLFSRVELDARVTTLPEGRLEAYYLFH